jgi:hypothetical protein
LASPPRRILGRHVYVYNVCKRKRGGKKILRQNGAGGLGARGRGERTRVLLEVGLARWADEVLEGVLGEGAARHLARVRQTLLLRFDGPQVCAPVPRAPPLFAPPTS